MRRALTKARREAYSKGEEDKGKDRRKNKEMTGGPNNLKTKTDTQQ